MSTYRKKILDVDLSTGAVKTSTAGIYIGWGGQQTFTQNVIWGLDVAVLVAGGVYRMQWNNNIITGNWTGIEINGRTAVILSRYGVTCPLEGLPTYGCVGLATDDARRLAANVVLYTIVRP